MARAKQQIGAEKPLYERDFYQWLTRQAALLSDGRLQELDGAHLLEEIEDMGRSEKAAIENSLIVLLIHLLKYRFQPDQRSSSWRGSIVEHRRRLRKLIRESPSLRPYAHEVYAECYADSCEQAAAETGLPPATFPAAPLFSLDQALDPKFLPD
jgi:Domain of unknown function DUF29